MSELAVCRMCLAVDVRMYSIAGTPLQDVYERITDIPLQNGDKKPKQVCYLCRHLLRKNQAFMEKSVKADELLRLVLDRGIELSEAYVRLMDTSNICSSLCVSRPILNNYVPQEPCSDRGSPEDVSTEIRVKDEPPDVKEEMEVEIEGMYLTRDCPEKGRNSPKQWTQTNANKPQSNLEQSSVTEIIINVKQERVCTPDLELLDSNPQNVQENNLKLNTQLDLKASLKVTTETKNVCDQCGFHFKSLKLIKNHRKINHFMSYICEYCRKVFDNKQSLIRHMRTHMADNMLQRCHSEILNGKDIFDQHIIKEHTAEKPHRCCHCNKAFSFKSKLFRHMLTHSGEKPYRCSHCDKAYTAKNHLNQHMLMHTGDKPHHCSYCNKSFSTKPKLNRHMLIHTGEKPHQCNYCRKSFCTKHNLNQHVLTHTEEKRHQCSYCNVSFSTKNHFNQHLLIHTGEKPHQCSYCNKAFTTKNTLNRHMLIHTGEKPYRCSHCNKGFSQKGTLNQHILMHTGEKPHRCSHCNRAFSDKRTLNKHMLIHTGEKPHRCSQCSREFSQKSTLNQHMLVHTGERPHQCSYCDKAFTKKNRLRQHILMHTGEKSN